MCPEIGNPKASCPNSNSEVIEEEQEVVKHWIEFKILDDTSAPVPEVSVQVSEKNKNDAKAGVSNENGEIQIYNISPGKYKLESDWKDANVYESVLIK